MGLDDTISFPDLPGYNTPDPKHFAPNCTDSGQSFTVTYEPQKGLEIRGSFVRRQRGNWLQLSRLNTKSVVVEASPSVLGPWTKLADVPMDATGRGQITNLVKESIQFLRAKTP